ncbi:MAG: DUF5723 family protein, partial [Cyclobacteriaceae bacterium]|nr:DUF5723 family protein [Cyclobacteriaceae bacterium]
MKKSITIFLLFFSTLTFTRAQHGIAFYHLRNGTFQNTSYNPAYFPHGRVFIGLPVISGVNVYFNNHFSYRDIIYKDETGVNQMDIQNALNKLTINNLVSTNVNVNLFHFGYRFYKGSAFSVFANERMEVDVTYPKSLLEWFWNGNGTFIGQTVDAKNLGMSANYFREYGIGYASPVPEEGLTYGFRLKYYQGMANASTPASLNARLLTENENFQFNMQTHNTILRTS